MDLSREVVYHPYKVICQGLEMLHYSLRRLMRLILEKVVVLFSRFLGQKVLSSLCKCNSFYKEEKYLFGIRFVLL